MTKKNKVKYMGIKTVKTYQTFPKTNDWLVNNKHIYQHFQDDGIQWLYTEAVYTVPNALPKFEQFQLFYERFL